MKSYNHNMFNRISGTKKIRKTSWIFVLLFGIPSFLWGQGCSDAGICSTGIMASGYNDEQGETFNNRYPEIYTGLGFSYGLGEKFISVFRLESETNIRISKGSSIDLKIPYIISVGQLGSAAGPGDIGINFNTILGYPSPCNTRFYLTAGFRIPTNNSDLKNNDNFDLPMAYQSSLGTFDLLIGLKADLSDSYSISTGYQHPIKHINSNTFNPSDFNNSNSQKFLSTPGFKRSPDAILRIQRNYEIKKHFAFASILFIYHITEDSFINEISGIREKYEGSSGFTVNLSNHIDFNLSDLWKLKLAAGFPVYSRHVRPDGLTRTIAAGLTLLMKI